MYSVLKFKKSDALPFCICGHSHKDHFDALKREMDELDYCYVYRCECLGYKTKKNRKELKKLVEHIRRGNG